MENIYNQTEAQRNSIVQLPDGFAKNSGDTLCSWLGSLWKNLHRGTPMIRGLQAARGFRLTQMYLDILETMKLQDRNGAPVFHRELWHPIVVRASLRNKAQANMLRMGGDDKKIGPQPPDSEYGEGTEFSMGKMANFKEFVTYPLSEDIAGGALTIVDNIVNPTVVLSRGDSADYQIRDGSIVFRKDEDPLGDNSPFDRMDIPGFDPEHPGKSDVEAVLWASDVLFDRDYIANHVSYAMGAAAPSSDVSKRIVNSAWSATTSGFTPGLAKTLMAAMLNVPVVQNDKETVIDMSFLPDGSILVRTDCGEYTVSAKAKLRKEVFSGAVMHKGDLFDESLRIYPFLNSDADPGFSVPIEQDIPSIILPGAMLRARTEYGVYAMWGDSEVRRWESDPVDANGNPHLYFDIGGTESDVEAFWRDIWDDAEKKGVSMADILQEGSMVSPARFLLRNLVGANTLFVVVDMSQIDDGSMMRDPMFFDMLSSVVPSAIRLFLVEHRGVGDDDIYDMGDGVEGESVAAALPRAVDVMSERALPGMEGRGPSHGESVLVRFVRPAPAKVRGRKEEE